MELAINIDLLMSGRSRRRGSGSEGECGQGAQSSVGIARAPFCIARLHPTQPASPCGTPALGLAQGPVYTA